MKAISFTEQLPKNESISLYLIWRPVAGWVIGRFIRSTKQWQRESNNNLITDATHWLPFPPDPGSEVDEVEKIKEYLKDRMERARRKGELGDLFAADELSLVLHAINNKEHM